MYRHATLSSSWSIHSLSTYGITCDLLQGILGRLVVTCDLGFVVHILNKQAHRCMSECVMCRETDTHIYTPTLCQPALGGTVWQICLVVISVTFTSSEGGPGTGGGEEYGHNKREGEQLLEKVQGGGGVHVMRHSQDCLQPYWIYIMVHHSGVYLRPLPLDALQILPHPEAHSTSQFVSWREPLWVTTKRKIQWEAWLIYPNPFSFLTVTGILFLTDVFLSQHGLPSHCQLWFSCLTCCLQ